MQIFSIILTHALFITILSRVFAIAALIMLVTLDRSARIVLPVVFIAALLWVSGKGKNKQVVLSDLFFLDFDYSLRLFKFLNCSSGSINKLN